MPLYEPYFHSRTSYRFLFCLTVLVAMPGQGRNIAADENARPGELRLCVQTEYELHAMVFALCRKTSDEELLRLECFSDRSISLAAAWEGARRSLLRAHERASSPEDALERFIDFVQDRVGGAVPDCWADGLKGARVTDQGFVIFPKAVPNGLYRNLSVDAHFAGKAVAIRGAVAPANIAIVPNHQGLAVRSQEQLIPLTFEVTEHLRMNKVAILHSKDGVFAALHTDLWHPYDVVRVDPHGNDHPWQCKVWAAGTIMTAGGEGFHHFVTMLEKGDELLVYGVSDACAYVEGFRKCDGLCTLRFGTCWGDFPQYLDLSEVKTDPPPEDGPQR